MLNDESRTINVYVCIIINIVWGIVEWWDRHQPIWIFKGSREQTNTRIVWESVKEIIEHLWQVLMEFITHTIFTCMYFMNMVIKFSHGNLDLLYTSSLSCLYKTPLCLLGFACVEFERIFGAYACPWNPFDLPLVHFHWW